MIGSEVAPEVLALIDYPSFASLLKEIKRGRHSIVLGSAEHRKLRRIAAYCNQAPPTNPELLCRECKQLATHVGVRAQRDGSLVTPDMVFCAAHLPDPRSGIYSIKILISTPLIYKGANRDALQGLIRRAYQLPSRITPEAAKKYFAHLETEGLPDPQSLYWMKG